MVIPVDTSSVESILEVEMGSFRDGSHTKTSLAMAKLEIVFKKAGTRVRGRKQLVAMP